MIPSHPAEPLGMILASMLLVKVLKKKGLCGQATIPVILWCVGRGLAS